MPRSFPGLDCKESPTPDMPGEGLAAFFEKPPNPLPKQEDPFAKGATTTIYEQYGYSGLRWHTYDLGCGPDAASHPDAVIGTAVSNWIINIPVAFSALTTSLTSVAFHPTFLGVFDPSIARISRALHRSLFATWLPAVLAILGLAILLKARRSALATTAASIGWALMVVLIAAAVFRWPLVAGHFADQSVSSTLGSVVGGIDGEAEPARPGGGGGLQRAGVDLLQVLAGRHPRVDRQRHREKYGADLFKAQTLTWREAYVVQHNPVAGKKIIEDKQDAWASIAGQIQARRSGGV